MLKLGMLLLETALLVFFLGSCSLGEEFFEDRSLDNSEIISDDLDDLAIERREREEFGSEIYDAKDVHLSVIQMDFVPSECSGPSDTAYGITQMHGKFYIICWKGDSRSVQEYSSSSLRHIKTITLPKNNYYDMAACPRNNKLYIEGNSELFDMQATVWKLNVVSENFDVLIDNVIEYPIVLTESTGCKMVFRGNDAVYVVNARGEILNRLNANAVLQQNPYRALRVNSNNVIVSHYSSKYRMFDLTLMTPEGRILGSFVHLSGGNIKLRAPWDMVLVDSKHFIISDSETDSLTLISTDLTEARILLSGPQYGLADPYAMSYDPDTGILIVDMLESNRYSIYRVSF